MTAAEPIGVRTRISRLAAAANLALSNHPSVADAMAGAASCAAKERVQGFGWRGDGSGGMAVHDPALLWLLRTIAPARRERNDGWKRTVARRPASLVEQVRRKLDLNPVLAGASWGPERRHPPCAGYFRQPTAHACQLV